jgi:acyl-CoA thioesterase I
MVRFVTVLLGVALILGGATAHAATPTIVVLGDSITAGLGVAPDEAYPALLQARLAREGYAYRVINAGVSGDTSAGGLRRLDWVMKLAPDIVIVALGANDGLRGLPADALRDNLAAIVQKIQSKHAKVLIAGMRIPPNYGAEYTRDFAKAFVDVARETGAPLLPFLLDGVAGDARLNLTDGIHPNVEGQRRIAEHVWPSLKPLLSKAAAGAAR